MIHGAISSNMRNTLSRGLIITRQNQRIRRTLLSSKTITQTRMTIRTCTINQTITSVINTIITRLTWRATNLILKQIIIRNILITTITNKALIRITNLQNTNTLLSGNCISAFSTLEIVNQ